MTEFNEQPIKPLLGGEDVSHLTGRYVARGPENLKKTTELAKDAFNDNPDDFLAGAEETHWSNPHGKTGGLPPEDNTNEIKPTTE